MDSWPLVLLAPSQAAAWELPRRLAASGRALAGVYPFKLQDLARALAEPALLGQGLRAWDSGHAALLAARLLDGPHGLPVPEGLPRAPLARALAQTLVALRRAGIAPERLLALAAEGDRAREDVERLRALAGLLRGFLEAVQGRFADAPTVLRAAAGHAGQAKWLEGARVLVMDELELGPAEREFLASLARTMPVERLARHLPPGLEARLLRDLGREPVAPGSSPRRDRLCTPGTSVAPGGAAPPPRAALRSPRRRAGGGRVGGARHRARRGGGSGGDRPPALARGRAWRALRGDGGDPAPARRLRAALHRSPATPPHPLPAPPLASPRHGTLGALAPAALPQPPPRPPGGHGIPHLRPRALGRDPRRLGPRPPRAVGPAEPRRTDRLGPGALDLWPPGARRGRTRGRGRRATGDAAGPAPGASPGREHPPGSRPAPRGNPGNAVGRGVVDGVVRAFADRVRPVGRPGARPRGRGRRPRGPGRTLVGVRPREVERGGRGAGGALRMGAHASRPHHHRRRARRRSGRPRRSALPRGRGGRPGRGRLSRRLAARSLPARPRARGARDGACGRHPGRRETPVDRRSPALAPRRHGRRAYGSEPVRVATPSHHAGPAARGASRVPRCDQPGHGEARPQLSPSRPAFGP